VESMKYHGREAYDWIKDMVATLDIGGPASRGAGGSYSGLSSAGIPTTNPVSHQSRVFGAGDIQEEGGAFGEGGGGFIRPQSSRTQSNSFRRFETNPVSHQTQVNAQTAQSLSFSTSASHSPSPPIQSPYPESTIPQVRRSGPPDSRGSTKDERDFMLGDEDEDAEELGDISVPPPLPQTITSSPPPRQGAAPSISATNSSISENPAATARGRDLGGDDVIRL
jgi:cation-dependent mannose-6-phosphate receptor